MRFRAFWVDWDTLFFFSKIFVSAKRKTRASEASVLVRLIVSKFHKKSFSAIELFFRNCVCCERLWLLRPSNLVSQICSTRWKIVLLVQLFFLNQNLSELYKFMIKEWKHTSYFDCFVYVIAEKSIKKHISDLLLALDWFTVFLHGLMFCGSEIAI